MRLETKRHFKELAERIDQADAGSSQAAPACQARLDTKPLPLVQHFQALAPLRTVTASLLAGFYHCFSSYEGTVGYYSQYIRFM